MAYWIAISLLIFVLLKDYFAYSLRLIEIKIPKHVVKGTTASLECYYDLDGEILYSVKWYKDGNEFYRYVPRDLPPVTIFQLPGVSIDLHNSSDVMVSLKNVNLSTTGRYRCEISGEAPLFQTVSDHGDMIVVSLPDRGPIITGGKSRYKIGEYVRTNCTSGRSKPAVQLTWFVNGELADPRNTIYYPSIISGREGLETSILGLQFPTELHHFRNGDMKLKCVARLSSIYWRSNEESVELDRPLRTPILESRETVYASNSRADPVQGMSSSSSDSSDAESIVTKFLSFFTDQTTTTKTTASTASNSLKIKEQLKITHHLILIASSVFVLISVQKLMLLNYNRITSSHPFETIIRNR